MGSIFYLFDQFEKECDWINWSHNISLMSELHPYLRCLDCEYSKKQPATLDNASSPLCDEVKKNIYKLKYQSFTNKQIAHELQKLYGKSIVLETLRL